MRTLSGALGALLRRAGGGSGAPERLPIGEVKAAGDVIVRDGGGEKSVFMTNDEPQKAGTQEWVLRAEDGTVIGLGRG